MCGKTHGHEILIPCLICAEDEAERLPRPAISGGMDSGGVDTLSPDEVSLVPEWGCNFAFSFLFFPQFFNSLDTGDF